MYVYIYTYIIYNVQYIYIYPFDSGRALPPVPSSRSPQHSPAAYPKRPQQSALPLEIVV